MINISKKIPNNLACVLLLLVCAAAIVISIPQHKDNKRILSIGNPWFTEDLIANYDFPIIRDSATIKAELDSLLSLRAPYFTVIEDMGEIQVARFNADYEKDHSNISPKLKIALERALMNIYATGIINTDPCPEIAKDTLHHIKIVKDKESILKLFTDYYSTKTVYDHLFDDPHLAQNRALLSDNDLQEYLKPNVIYNDSLNIQEINEIKESIIPTGELIKKGTKLIGRGELVTQEKMSLITSYDIAYSQKQKDNIYGQSTRLGQILYVLVMLTILYVYIYLFRKDYFEKPRLLMMLFLTITVFAVLVATMMRFMSYNVYLLPFAILPMFIRVFMDSRTAFFGHVVMILICAIALNYQYDFIIIQLVAGAVAIFSMRHLTRRSEVFIAALYVTIATLVIYTALQLMQDKPWYEYDVSYIKSFVVNGILLLFAYPAMYLVERLFGFTSDVTLIELSNTSHPLLRNLSMVAPGTYQHCTMVSNLAAEIAEKIDAQSQLVRTGALYHDIGKSVSPENYIENQNGIPNPLETKDRREAAGIIISHVSEGIRLAKEAGLPEEIIAFIRTHHGTGCTKYFYLNYKSEHPKEDVDPVDFSYDGPNPQTKEQAILMMADAVEAAARSLQEHSEGNITTLVNNIIDGQVKDGFYDNCPLNFKDIKDAKEVLIERLMAIYHTRIAYPKEG